MKVETKTEHIFVLANHQNSHIMPYLRAVGAGTITGMRSMAALPAVSRYFDEHAPMQQPPHVHQRRRLFVSRSARTILHGLAAGEMIADKFSIMPDRTALMPLLGRCMLGALSGATLFSAHRKQSISGAITGGTTALVSTYASYRLRSTLSEKAHLPNPIAGLVEDVAVLAIRRALLTAAT
jgi:uncharacterized membrane protein